jgi:hypothetical protein
MKVIKEQEFYAPTYLTDRDKKSGTVFTRIFRLVEKRNGKRHIEAQHNFRFFSWQKNSKKSEATALAATIGDMKEMKEIENNPPLSFIPDRIERWLE